MHIRLKKNFFSIACVLIFNTGFVWSQEYTLPLFSNINYYIFPSPVRFVNHLNTQKTTSVSLPLPFFDDFYYADRQVYPDMNKWVDSSVYINFGYAKYPVSFGVATFDGLNKKGFPYKTSSTSTASEPADTLTSQPINLLNSGSYTYTPADSIALVFYYQRMGNGDNPESSDSLILDFYKPAQNMWQNAVWSVTGSNIAPVNDSTFTKVHIYLTDTAYFHDGFRFRFRNKATPVGAVDHWHLDYIKLDKNLFTTDTIVDDAAFYYMSSPLLKNYSAMPYKHFLPSEMAVHINNFIKNNNRYTTKNVNYQFNIYDANGNFLYNYNGGSANVSPGRDTVKVHRNPNFSYTVSPADTTRYYVKHFINTVPDTWAYNDTLVQCTPLTNYFAYDDGQAELGYYLKFYGTQVALKYTLNVTDTLRAMDIFFIPVNNYNITNKNIFRMCVWSNISGQPGNLIYRDSLMAPKFLDWGYNQLPRYNLTQPLVLSPGTYFFGIQAFPPSSQYTVTIGLDVNYNHSDAAYYNSTGSWNPSSVKGSLMIHPVFGDSAKAVGIKENESIGNYFHVYPNPLENTNQLRIRTDYQDAYKIRVLNMLGQEIYTQDISGSSDVYLPGIGKGMFVLQIMTPHSVINKKLILK
ncbi:MAG: hypothetical protein KatS3mg028_0395 [Bacteroidia bacterium]|nr:MAG: hypothetical protein KatS3mg028_0395 [Bacteroidia bacterium]